MKKLKVFFTFCLICIIPGVVLADGIKANVAEVILTPPLEIGYTLGGYGARMSKPAKGVHDDIKAKALIMQQGGIKYALVTLDILGLPPNVKPQVIERLNNDEWTEENIMFLPSHSHTSLEMFALNDKNIFGMPQIGIFQPELLEYVVKTISELILLADKDLQEVKIGTERKIIEGMNRNRRGEPFLDSYLTVTRIDYVNDSPMTALVNWTGHPTLMDEDDMWVSGGWPGYLQRELEAWIGHDAIAMYYNGAEGDQSVIGKNAGSHYEKAENYGRDLAVKALGIYNNIRPEKSVEFKYNFKIIELPERKAHPGFMETGGEEYGLNEENIQVLLNQVFPEKTSIGVCKIGDLLIIGIPGEMTAELGLEIKNKLNAKGVKYPVIGGLANQWISYIMSEEAYDKSGYEASVSFYGKELGSVIVKGALNAADPLNK